MRSTHPYPRFQRLRDEMDIRPLRYKCQVARNAFRVEDWRERGYRYCLGDEGSARHTPGPSEMIQRIIDRFETLNLLDEATKSGRNQEWGDNT